MRRVLAVKRWSPGRNKILTFYERGILLGMSITQFVNSDAININIPHDLRYIRWPENIFITRALTRARVRDFAIVTHVPRAMAKSC